MTRRTVEAGGRTIVLDDGLLDADREALSKLPPARPARFVAAASHVVLEPRPRTDIDFDATLALRRRLAAHGFAIAEAMDTAQRFEIGWDVARELIRRTGRANLEHGFIAGAGGDSCADPMDRDSLVAGVQAQAREIQASGGAVILLPLPSLVAMNCSADDYVAVYRAILGGIDGPVFLHWLGPMFMPALRGYFPGDSFDRILRLDPAKVRGAKLSLLDAELEKRVRREMLGRGQIVLTGDDHHFASLIEGDGAPPAAWTTLFRKDVALGDFSHGLLGIFDAIAAPAGVALQWLAHGNVRRYRELMTPLERLGQAIFEAPVSAYKAGLAYLSWLNGYQDEFRLVNGAERLRDREHYLRVAEIAGVCGAIEDADVAAERAAARENGRQQPPLR